MDPTEDPPAYEASAPGPATEILPPSTLYFAGHFICSSDADAPPLYQLVHAADLLRDAGRSVGFERLECAVRNVDGTPTVSTRQKRMFDIKRPTPAEFANFDYQAESASRHTLCSFGLSTFRPSKLSSRKGYRIHRATRGPDRRLAPQELLFTATPTRKDTVTFEWADAQDHILAREVDTDDLMSLVVTAELEREVRDALAAAWITRMWWELRQEGARKRQWEQGQTFSTVLV